MSKKWGYQSPGTSDPAQTGFHPEFPWLLLITYSFSVSKSVSERENPRYRLFVAIFSIFNIAVFSLMPAEWAEGPSSTNKDMKSLCTHFLYLFRWLFFIKQTFLEKLQSRLPLLHLYWFIQNLRVFWFSCLKKIINLVISLTLLRLFEEGSCQPACPSVGYEALH